MTYAYHITQYNGIDYSTKSAKWNLVSQRRTQQQALAMCQHLNRVKPYNHRVEVVKAIELPKFSVLKVAKNDSGAITIPASFKVIKKENWFKRFCQRFLGGYFHV